MFEQQRERLGTEARRLDPLAGAEELGEVPHQKRNVLAPIAQRRQLDLDALEPVVEIVAKATLGHQRLQIAVRGGHQPHVDRNRGLSADAEDLSLLQGTQELHLNGLAEIADLVEKEGAGGGELELAAARFDAGRDSPFDAEQLALEQRLGDGGAVDRHQRPASLRLEMDQLGHQLLAGTALAPHHHAHSARGHPLGQIERPPHRCGLGDDPAATDLADEVALERAVLFLEPLALDLELFHLARAVERHRGQRGDRLQEAPVLDAEAGGAAPPLLLVQEGHIAEVDPAVDQGSRQQAGERPAGQRAVAERQRLAAGQELAPQRVVEKLLGRRRALRPTDPGEAPRPAEPVARDRHRRRGIDDRAHLLDELVDQLLLRAVSMERHPEVVESLELENAPLLRQ